MYAFNYEKIMEFLIRAFEFMVIFFVIAMIVSSLVMYGYDGFKYLKKLFLRYRAKKDFF